MHTNENTLRNLADRAGAGDLGAAAQLRQELQPYLRRIARRALRPTAAASTLTRRVRAAAARLSPDETFDAEALAGPVARSLGESLVRGLQARAGGHKMMETVCD